MSNFKDTIAAGIKKMKARQAQRDKENPGVKPGKEVVVQQKPSPPPSSGTYIVWCWNEDMYILKGYKSVDEIIEKFNKLNWIKMPNGTTIQKGAVKSVQSYEDYKWQINQKVRHKKGQYIGGGEQDDWIGVVEGYTSPADTKVITAAPAQLPTGNELTGGQ